MSETDEYQRRAFERSSEKYDWQNRPENECAPVKEGMYVVGCPSEHWVSIENMGSQ
ncbi:MAG: hypothetical protein WB611_33350 [Stellaceae bacterium]